VGATAAAGSAAGAAGATAGTPASASGVGGESAGGANAGASLLVASGSSTPTSAAGSDSGAASSGAAASCGTASGAVAIGDGSDGGSSPDSEAGPSTGGCAGKTYKLCEDFESGTVGGIPTGWTVLTGWGAKRGGVGLADDEAHSGRMSLKSDMMVTGEDRVQKSLAGLGATVTKHWGRVFYKVGAPPPKPNTGVIHITFTALEGTTENRVVDTVVATNGAYQWLFNIPDDSCCVGSSYDWSFDAAWHCAEWNIDVAAESFAFYSDGKEVPQLTFSGKAGAKMSDYTSLALGTIYYQTPPSPVVVWFDDLAIDDNEIGCQ
jgi:hypothetical protein